MGLINIGGTSGISGDITKLCQTMADIIKDTVADFSNMTKKEVEECRKKAYSLSKKALWGHFIKYYQMAYDIALRKAAERTSVKVRNNN